MTGAAGPAAPLDPSFRGLLPGGIVDRLIRHYGVIALAVVVLLFFGLAAAVFGLALALPLWLLFLAWELVAALPHWQRWPLFGFALGNAFFLSGFCLMAVVVVLNRLLPTRPREFHGPYFTVAALPWFLHNALFYLVRYTFLPWVTLTPFGRGFLRGMGMRIGRRAFINTEFISDPCLISLGDDAVIGGSVHLFAHYGGGGHLSIVPVRIGHRVTVGQEATVMGDVVIGDGATILPHSVLLPGSRVGAGETWGGVPARPIPREALDRLKAEIRGEHPPAP